MSAAALNAFHSVLLKSVAGDDTLSITVNNHPLPRNIDPEEVLYCMPAVSHAVITVMIIY